MILSTLNYISIYQFQLTVLGTIEFNGTRINPQALFTIGMNFGDNKKALDTDRVSSDLQVIALQIKL